MSGYRTIRLICGKCGHRFNVRDAGGNVRIGSATVKRIVASGVVQICPKCGHTKNPDKLREKLFRERRTGQCEA